MNCKPCQHGKPWTRCKPCRKAWRKALYWRDPQGASKAASAWGKRNPERRKKIMASYYASLEQDQRKKARFAELKRGVLSRARQVLSNTYVNKSINRGGATPNHPLLIEAQRERLRIHRKVEEITK